MLGFGGGASVGIGNKGPGLGANVAFGPIGTLLIGSHRNSYPGAQQTASHMPPSRSASYYAAQDYGNRPYYQPASKQQRQAVPVQAQAQEQYYNRCAGAWTC